MTKPSNAPSLEIVPANQASWKDIQAVFGTTGDAHRCQCQRFKTPAREWDRQWASGSVGERAKHLRAQTRCGRPNSTTTNGLVAYLAGEPVGWCAVEPRTEYVRLGRIPWTGRKEDKTDAGIWAVPCFITRAGYRRRGISRALACAAVDFARQRGARALEGYPIITQPGREIAWGEVHVGSRSIFVDAGFTEVSRPSLRRVVMRFDF
jgi:GNAT superfamily N-acetyltransferase